VSTSRPEDRSLVELVRSMTTDVTTIAKDQVELAKSELRDSARHGGTGAGLAAGAALLMFLASVLFSVAAAYGLVALGLHPALAFLIVGAVYVLVAAILGLVARSQFRRITPPERTIASIKETTAVLRQSS
jgi:Putative Actinobacterial Holin-X, holin superfamily III